MVSRYPHRPHNHSKTLPFHTLFKDLFDRLNENRKKPGSHAITSRKKVGPDGPFHRSPQEQKRHIIASFIARWRKEVGNDFYPVLRLIVPEKDRDRAMYGLKEKTIAKLLVRLTGLDKNSEDAQNLLNWKLPGFKVRTSAGDFAARCYDVLVKRPLRTQLGDMTIAQVNAELDKLSLASKEEEQMPILQNCYQNMNSEEFMWLIRVILRQMKVGATEKSFFELWHPDADSLFNVSSSLRRVCWELYDPEIRLENDRSTISLMQCFQPQLAAFQMHAFDKIVERMRPVEQDTAFWIEEKLDGERLQMHMVEDASVDGGMRFAWWSRKAKDYTYLYGNGFMDEDSALTRHLKTAFKDGVRNIILDGEMIGWNMEQMAFIPFGTLKSAALEAQKSPYDERKGLRPIFRVFDCLYMNDKPLTGYTLRDRRKALAASVDPIEFRLEIHSYVERHKAEEIEPVLREVIERDAEGLVIKSPRSIYRLNERNDDWIKVKPEYMNEFGEDLDCIVIGGYYGSGARRGGSLSSFMCGLRVDQHQVRQGANPQKCFSFFKVGGGFSADDYASIRHTTEGKWQKYDPKKPPTEYIELAGREKQHERPDVWIKPEDSIVISVKASSLARTEQFRTGYTLRFPRFKKVRSDKDWKSSLTILEFEAINSQAEREKQDKQFEIDKQRRERRAAPKRQKKGLTIAGEDDNKAITPFAGPVTKLFEGLTFFVISEALTPIKKTKNELEEIIKINGGTIVQSQNSKENVICVADREPLKVRSIRKEGKLSIVKPKWIFDCIAQAEIDRADSFPKATFVLPMEPAHMHYTCEKDVQTIEGNVDAYGDSYCRDLKGDELRRIFEQMPAKKLASSHDLDEVLDEIEEHHDVDLSNSIGFLFRRCVVYFDAPSFEDGHADDTASDNIKKFQEATRLIRFANGTIRTSLQDRDITHVVIVDRSRVQEIRSTIAKRSFSIKIPRIVSIEWVFACWKEKTSLDEEEFKI